MALEGLQLGQYRLLRLLGSGGMGEVYLAEDARINQQVAIKVSRTEVTPYPNNNSTQEVVRLFQREAKAIARLDHPHILTLFSYGEEKVNGMTLIYIVMPYRREGSFVDWLQQRDTNESLSVQNVAYFISQAASALQYAHNNQVVHQDVKPSNFLIRTNNEHPKLPDLLLADFGIAKLSTSTSSISHTIRGTPTYMAPEQWSGEPVYATDQYALAVFAYELLTGRAPFTGRQEQVMYQHFSVQPQPPGIYNPQLSTDVNAVILKALAKQPGDRFPSIAAFADAFQQATQNLDASTIIRPFNTPGTSDLHVTLAISKAEAQNSTIRTLTLPGGRQISVPIPAGAYDGQVLRLPQMSEPLYAGGPPGTLILTLSVQETDKIAPSATSGSTESTVLASPSSTSEDKTVRSSGRNTGSSTPLPTLLPTNVAEVHPPQPIARQQGITTGTAILLIGLLFLLIVGGFGFLYFSRMNPSSSNTTNSVTTPSGRNTNSVPTVLSTSTIASTTPIPPATPTPPATPIPTSYVQLNSYYSGSASGYASGSVTFTLKSEDQQGNLSMQTTFQQLNGSQKTAIYDCQGSIATDRNINLQCTNVADATYVLTIQGYVYQDNHIEGTETATNTIATNYSHVYSFKVY